MDQPRKKSLLQLYKRIHGWSFLQLLRYSPSKLFSMSVPPALSELYSQPSGKAVRGPTLKGVSGFHAQRACQVKSFERRFRNKLGRGILQGILNVILLKSVYSACNSAYQCPPGASFPFSTDLRILYSAQASSYEPAYKLGECACSVRDRASDAALHSVAVRTLVFIASRKKIFFESQS